jgi:hypothetical protein
MDFFMNVSGYYRSAYNSDFDKKGKYFDTKGREIDLPGPKEERRAYLRARIYERTKVAPRTFVYYVDANGKNVLTRTYVSK